ncbi:MAG: hypothetical protein ACEQSB_07505, partial [Undibacterium sp.]
FTGKRTTALPTMAQFSGAKKGFFQGYKEAKAGINTTNVHTQFDLPQVPTFRKGVLAQLEKAMRISLQAPDRAAYQAAFDDTIKGLTRANKNAKVTPEMLETAHYNGLYRTFQDDNITTQLFQGLKKSFNKIGYESDGKTVGLGDLILKYPKTPANLLNRGLAYSPAGMIRTIFHAARPLFGKEFNQKAFVDSFSKSIVGTTGLVGTGMYLNNLGIITAKPSEKTDVRNMERMTGLGGYKINVSALKRFVGSGMNEDAAKLREGDTLVNYDWAQPVALGLSIGANISEGGKLDEQKAMDIVDTIVNSVGEGTNTLAEQPLVQGVQRLFGYGLKEGVQETGKGSLASFVPTFM